jgi:hypothetical protein
VRWVEFCGGPYDGGFGGLQEDATYPLPVMVGELLEGNYAPGSPPEFCLDLDALSAAAGSQEDGRKLLNSGVVRVRYVSVLKKGGVA